MPLDKPTFVDSQIAIEFGKVFGNGSLRDMRVALEPLNFTLM